MATALQLTMPASYNPSSDSLPQCHNCFQGSLDCNSTDLGGRSRLSARCKSCSHCSHRFHTPIGKTLLLEVEAVVVMVGAAVVVETWASAVAAKEVATADVT
eukprot:1814327-Prymnesium_polylepis.1